MSKKVVHLLMPIDYKGESKIPLNTCKEYYDNIKKRLGNEYIVIMSPFETKIINGDNEIININFKDYTYKELIEIIEKAKIYDNLCI